MHDVTLANFQESKFTRSAVESSAVFKSDLEPLWKSLREAGTSLGIISSAYDEQPICRRLKKINKKKIKMWEALPVCSTRVSNPVSPDPFPFDIFGGMVGWWWNGVWWWLNRGVAVVVIYF